jgi:hypothetical protein
MCKFSIQIEPVAATMASDILQASCHYRKFGRCLECCLWQRLSAVICRIEPLWRLIATTRQVTRGRSEPEAEPYYRLSCPLLLISANAVVFFHSSN